MRKPRLTDPLRRPQFRRLAASYAVNELGDWMGIVALSVLGLRQTGSALATAALFLGTGFLPALIAPILVARVERPPPRFALPVIYCGEAAAFGALALLAGTTSPCAAVIVAGDDRRRPGADRPRADPRRRRRAARAGRRTARRQRGAQRRLHRRRRGRPGIAGLVVAGFGVQSALLLDAASFYAIAWILLHRRAAAPGRARTRPGPRPRPRRPRLHPRAERPCGGCWSPRAPPSSSSPR